MFQYTLVRFLRKSSAETVVARTIGDLEQTIPRAGGRLQEVDERPIVATQNCCEYCKYVSCRLQHEQPS